LLEPASKKSPLILNSLLGNGSNNEIPVWLMRQAGRYLPEYRALKERYTFNELSESPDLAAEVTIQPLIRFKELDAAIFFADILTPSKSLGFQFDFVPGPKLRNPIKGPEDILSLGKLNVSEVNGFVFEGISKVRSFLENEERETRRAMLGFAATPWTLACYLIDQGIYKQHLGTKIFAEKYPDEFANLCSLISEITIEYLTLKHKAGADAVQLFDTWASLLNPNEYYNLSGRWIENIVSKLREKNIPVILYTQGDLEIIKYASKFNLNGLSIDWKLSLEEVRKIVPLDICLQGNFDPCKLFSNEDRIKSETENLFGNLKNKNIIANLGHGVLPGTPVENVETLLQTIKSI
jgi:uroporphyrinogen decarboxylase